MQRSFRPPLAGCAGILTRALLRVQMCQARHLLEGPYQTESCLEWLYGVKHVGERRGYRPSRRGIPGQHVNNKGILKE